MKFHQFVLSSKKVVSKRKKSFFLPHGVLWFCIRESPLSAKFQFFKDKQGRKLYQGCALLTLKVHPWYSYNSVHLQAIFLIYRNRGSDAWESLRTNKDGKRFWCFLNYCICLFCLFALPGWWIKMFIYFSHFSRSLHSKNLHQVCTYVQFFSGKISCDNFCNKLRGSDSTGIESCPSSLTMPLAFNIVLRSCVPCENAPSRSRTDTRHHAQPAPVCSVNTRTSTVACVDHAHFDHPHRHRPASRACRHHHRHRPHLWF